MSICLIDHADERAIKRTKRIVVGSITGLTEVDCIYREVFNNLQNRITMYRELYLYSMT
jgi:hypothetical protein